MKDRSAREGGGEVKNVHNLMTFQLHKLGGQSERFSESYYRSLFGLSLTECRIIGITAANERTTFKMVCENAHLEKSYASRVLNGLVEQGLVRKEGNPQDQRSILLVLTKKGQELHARLRVSAEALNLQMMSVLTSEQIATFITCIRLLQERLSELGQPAEIARFIKAGAKAGSAQKLVSQPSRKVEIELATLRQLHEAIGAILRRDGTGHTQIVG